MIPKLHIRAAQFFSWFKRAGQPVIETDLIVMRLAEMWNRHPKQDNSRVCAVCREQVGVYPDGQELLKERPSTRIVCHHCYILEPLRGAR